MSEPVPFGRYVITDPAEQQRWIGLAERYDPAGEPVVADDGEPFATWSDMIRDHLVHYPEAEVAVVFTDWGDDITWRIMVDACLSIDFGRPLWRTTWSGRKI